MQDGKLSMHALANVGGAKYEFQLSFESAAELTIEDGNAYFLRVHCTWPTSTAEHDEFYRKTSRSWFAYWTQEFTAASPVPAGVHSIERYRELCEEALNAEAELSSVAVIQQVIVEKLKNGASFASSHKEGGSKLYWSRDRFVRVDYGDDPAERHYQNEVEFLGMLEQFCGSDVTRNSAEQLTEVERWRLIYRCMRQQ